MNLETIYEEQLRNSGNPEVSEITESTEKTETEVVSEKNQPSQNSMKKPKNTKNESFDSLFQSILKEADEYENFEGDDLEGDFSDDLDTGDDLAGDTVTVSRAALEDLKSQIDALLSGTEETGETYDDGFDYDDEFGTDDDVPKESSWDGKLSPQQKSKLVKDNGDVNFNQKTGLDPDAEGGEAEHKDGPRGTFDGKLGKQKPTDLVKGNGDANFGKVKTGFKKTDKTGNKLFGK